MKEERNPLTERLELLGKARKSSGNIYQIREEDLDDEKKKKKKRKKQKVKRPSADAIYLLTLSNYQMHLTELVCLINDIPIERYVFASSPEEAIIIDTLKIDDEFKQRSKLDWEEPAPIDGLTFRGRFATLLLVQMIRRSHRIVKGLYYQTKGAKHHGRKKYNNLYYLLDRLIKIVDGFVIGYLNQSVNYVPYLRKIEELLFVSMYEEETISECFDHLSETEEFLLKKEGDDVEVSNLVRIAYILATGGDRGMKKCPPYESDFKYKSKVQTIGQVGGLGYAILLRREKGEKIPPIYKAFVKANPQVISRFYEVSDEMPEVVVGLRAMEFTKLFTTRSARSKLQQAM